MLVESYVHHNYIASHPILGFVWRTAPQFLLNLINRITSASSEHEKSLLIDQFSTALCVMEFYVGESSWVYLQCNLNERMKERNEVSQENSKASDTSLFIAYIAPSLHVFLPLLIYSLLVFLFFFSFL